MATLQLRPTTQFNFLVDIGSGDPNSLAGGFQEVTGLGTEMTVMEYRTGNDPNNSVLKLTGLNKASDVTLKRGVMGSLDLYTWFNDIRLGTPNQLRLVTITLQNSEHQPVVTWKLGNARLIKYVMGALNAKGTDVAVEEFVLAYERLEME
jgi:phage tail-like protein